MSPLTSALKPLGLQPGPLNGPDFTDGTTILEAKGGGGVRDLHAAVTQLAIHAHNQKVQRAILLVQDARMSGAGIQKEWQRTLGILAPDIARKLELVALLGNTVVVLPDDAYLHDLADRAAKTPRQTQSRPDRSFEVMRVLVSRWLQNQGPISPKDLQEQTGLSHPTVSKSLAGLKEVERRSDRSVSLQKFPRDSWFRLLAMAPQIRQTRAFVDQSGRADPRRLLERLKQRCPPGVAIGGVIAARHWHPDFDLDGIPRLDLSVHRPAEDLAKQLHPALIPAPSGVPPILVLHTLIRAESLFVGTEGLLWADPAEVLLDLQELRLEVQGEEFTQFLRRPR